jgi:RNA polymerase sigma-70 factor (ECF subfamily)
VPSLAPAFLIAAGKPPDKADERLEAMLRAHLEAARQAWPGVDLDEKDFAAYLGERAADTELSALRTSDLFLACACLTSRPEALAAFEEHFLSPLDVHLRRYHPSPHFADEVRQILRERFFVWVDGQPPRIATYNGRGALGGWVRVAAVRVALRLASGPGDTSSPPESPAGPDPELDYVRARYRGAFDSALSHALSTLDAAERNLLRLHFVDGLTIDRLAPLFRVHRSTAARRLADARGRLITSLRARLAESLRISGRELDSLLGVLQSRLELDVSKLFKSN